MKNILLPLGSSDNPISTTQIQYTVDLARELKATVYVIKVFKEISRSGSLPEVNKTLKEITETQIKKKLEGINKKGVTVISHPIEGELLEEIPKFNLQNSIDLIILSPNNSNINDPYFLSEVFGSIIKRTEIPVLVVPREYHFKPISKVLMAIKSGIIKNKNVLAPIKEILSTFNADLRLLQVKTTDYLPEDSEFHKDLGELISSYKSSENATLFQGVLEHLNENNLDMICVFRRKRGFFSKLWENNGILKKDFESRIPLLVLRCIEK